MTDPGLWLAIAFGLYFIGLVAVLLLPGRMTATSLAGAAGLGSLALLVFSASALFAGSSYTASLWSIPNIGTLSVRVDALSAFFLVVTALVALPAAFFAAARLGHARWQAARYQAALYLGLLMAILLVLVAGDIFLFLLAWELMSICTYLLVSSSAQERPGYLMLAIGEAGTLAVLIALLLLAGNADTLSFAGLKAAAGSLTPGLHWLIFILSFIGFGVKGGLIPVNFWIPRAYAAAPPAFIPLIAGATLNLGLYGIIRVNMDLLPATEAGPGIVMLIVGSFSALIGILYASIEDDFKTLLAHSSIENAGIITTALGAGSIFLATGHRVPAAIALIAALYHLLNHSMFKTLLFMGVGVVEEAAGTRSLDRLGGLLKRLPWTGLFVLVGALSISAMPPFNGFVSEWLTLESLLRSVELASLGTKIAFVVAGVALALTAGLAVTSFIRAFAMGFLGMPRSQAVREASETSRRSLAPMAFLALVCLALGVLPTYVIPALDRVVAPLAGASGSSALVPTFYQQQLAVDALPEKFVAEFHDLGAQLGQQTLPGRGLAVMHRGGEKNPVVFAMSTSYMLVALLGLLGVCAGLVWLLVTRHRKITRRPRWDGGVRRLLPEMTYTATGFAQPVRVIFQTILRPRVVDHREMVAEHFRVSIRRQRQEIHLMDRLVLYPLSAAAQWIAATLARMHHGRINAYAGYALCVLLLFLVISANV